MTPLNVEQFTLGEIVRYLRFFRANKREPQPPMTFDMT